MKTVWIISIAASSLLVAAAGVVEKVGGDRQGESSQGSANPPHWDQVLFEARIFLGRLPEAMPGSENDTPEKVALGKQLYFEQGISCNKTQSCNDCHLLTEGRAGVDNTPTSKGATGTFGKRNSPTVINAGFQTAQFWDGRATDLIEQAKGPVLNPIEMGMPNADEVVKRVKQIAGYEEAFRRAFPGDLEPITYDHIAAAIAAFERTLVAPSRFDKLLAGDANALTAQEKRGLAAFVENSCIECHSGATIGGRMYRKIGHLRPYENNTDLGRYEITKKEEDRQVFKVPMLRNVTRTQPYFHHGQVPDLEEAVHLMGELQLDIELSHEMIKDIIAFLGALEGNPELK
jgi:cytochrome c peroxidase